MSEKVLKILNYLAIAAGVIAIAMLAYGIINSLI